MTDDHKKRCAELETIIASAITLMEDGERGTALRLLKTGSAKPPVTSTGVLTKGVA